MKKRGSDCSAAGVNLDLAQYRRAIQLELANAVFRSLNAHQIRYAVVSGCAKFPHEISSDIDLFVSRSDEPQLGKIIAQSAEVADGLLVNVLQYHYGTTYIVCSERSGRVGTLWIDTACEFRQFRRLWLRSDDLLKEVRLDNRGFYRLGPELEFRYHLIKKVNKGKIGAEEGSELSRRYSDCSQFADGYLRQKLSSIYANLLRDALDRDDWRAVQASIGDLKREFRSRLSVDTRAGRLAFEISDLIRKARRILRPTGACITVSSHCLVDAESLLQEVGAELSPAFRSAIVCLRGSKSLRRVTQFGLSEGFQVIGNVLRSRLVLRPQQMSRRDIAGMVMGVLFPGFFNFVVQTSDDKAPRNRRSDYSVTNWQQSEAQQIIRDVLRVIHMRTVRRLLPEEIKPRVVE